MESVDEGKEEPSGWQVSACKTLRHLANDSLLLPKSLFPVSTAFHALGRDPSVGWDEISHVINAKFYLTSEKAGIWKEVCRQLFNFQEICWGFNVSIATDIAETKYEEHSWVCLCLSYFISVSYNAEGLAIKPMYR